MKQKKKLTNEEWNEIAYSEWWKHLDLEEAKKPWNKNLAACKQAIEYHYKKERPLEVLVVHGSGRDPKLSCAHERSNSELILETGLQAIENEKDINIERVRLREYKIETCNNCLSSTSYLCGFPCDCFPDDPMHKLYPKVLTCDVLLCSTGINQSSMSSSLKLFCDRLISLDGGGYRKELKIKDAKFKSEMIKLSQDSGSPYDPRMFNRVAAYFIASKDQSSTRSAIQDSEETIPENLKRYMSTLNSPISYAELVAWSLADGFRDYQMWHADPWYVVGTADADAEYSYDKDYYNKDTKLHEKSKTVVQAAINLAREIRKNPPKWKDMPRDRINRT